nr:MAG TPA: hypothetical protein [Caudoviricetes sp.]
MGVVCAILGHSYPSPLLLKVVLQFKEFRQRFSDRYPYP